MLGAYICANVFNSTHFFMIYYVINTLEYLLIAFIMDQVNFPQFTVWANRKFVGKNKE
jgi:hypothetical protein